MNKYQAVWVRLMSQLLNEASNRLKAYIQDNSCVDDLLIDAKWLIDLAEESTNILGDKLEHEDINFYSGLAKRSSDNN